jgi:hypothetical protein
MGSASNRVCVNADVLVERAKATQPTRTPASHIHLWPCPMHKSPTWNSRPIAAICAGDEVMSSPAPIIAQLMKMSNKLLLLCIFGVILERRLECPVKTN